MVRRRVQHRKLPPCRVVVQFFIKRHSNLCLVQKKRELIERLTQANAARLDVTFLESPNREETAKLPGRRLRLKRAELARRKIA